jgi:hypothetical protein
MSEPNTFCPVPKEQQPINEYQELQNSWFFSWGKLDLPTYATKLFWIGVWCQFVTAPLAAASFQIDRQPIQFLLLAVGGSLVFVTLALARLYVGWNHIRNRLQDEQIFYEESGWYDGQIWQKTPEIITRDRLLVSYEIQPILRRIQLSLLTILGAVVAGEIVFWLLG